MHLKYQVEAGPDSDRSPDFEKPCSTVLLARFHLFICMYVCLFCIIPFNVYDDYDHNN